MTRDSRRPGNTSSRRREATGSGGSVSIITLARRGLGLGFRRHLEEAYRLAGKHVPRRSYADPLRHLGSAPTPSEGTDSPAIDGVIGVEGEGPQDEWADGGVTRGGSFLDHGTGRAHRDPGGSFWMNEDHLYVLIVPDYPSASGAWRSGSRSCPPPALRILFISEPGGWRDDPDSV